MWSRQWSTTIADPLSLVPLRRFAPSFTTLPRQGGGDDVAHSTTKLIPADSSHDTLPSSAATKRDHDEWLVQWRSGGARSLASGRSLSRYVANSSFREKVAHAMVHWWGGSSSPPARSDPTDGLRCVGEVPNTRSGEAKNPDRPARREPHYYCGLPLRGSSLAGPASLPSTRGQQPAGASARPLTGSLPNCCRT